MFSEGLSIGEKLSSIIQPIYSKQNILHNFTWIHYMLGTINK